MMMERIIFGFLAIVGPMTATPVVLISQEKLLMWVIIAVFFGGTLSALKSLSSSLGAKDVKEIAILKTITGLISGIGLGIFTGVALPSIDWFQENWMTIPFVCLAVSVMSAQLVERGFKGDFIDKVVDKSPLG